MIWLCGGSFICLEEEKVLMIVDIWVVEKVGMVGIVIGVIMVGG